MAFNLTASAAAPLSLASYLPLDLVRADSTGDMEEDFSANMTSCTETSIQVGDEIMADVNLPASRTEAGLRALVDADPGAAWDGLRVVGSAFVMSPRVVALPVYDPDSYRQEDRLVPRIRLRVALHAGEVLRGPCGWVGTDLNTACRMVNGSPLYRELMRNPQSDLVLIVSDAVHQAVVRHGHRGVDPAEYAPVHLQAKELDIRAWIERPHQTVRNWQRLRRSG